eukprot:8120825-Heterocapsa_arctica.AAC.1
MTRLDLACYVAALQKAAVPGRATILHVRRLNSLVRWAQKNPKSLCYKKMACPDSLIQVSDSAFKAEGHLSGCGPPNPLGQPHLPKCSHT